MTPETPVVPVSWGELVDKITILEIKRERLASPAAVANAVRELDALMAVFGPYQDRIVAEKAALSEVNRRLWDIEDAIRAKESQQDFGAEFVALARSVCHVNDERGAAKAAVNKALNSELVEEKNYTKYR